MHSRSWSQPRSGSWIPRKAENPPSFVSLWAETSRTTTTLDSTTSWSNNRWSVDRCTRCAAGARTRGDPEVRNPCLSTVLAVFRVRITQHRSEIEWSDHRTSVVNAYNGPVSFRVWNDHMRHRSSQGVFTSGRGIPYTECRFVDASRILPTFSAGYKPCWKTEMSLFFLEKWTLRGLWKDFAITSTVDEVTVRTLSNMDLLERSLHGRLWCHQKSSLRGPREVHFYHSS